MARFKVLLTDYAWADLDLERQALREADAELVVAEKTDAATLAELASDADAIMTNWAKVPEPVIAAGAKLRIVARLGIGLDNIDVEAATRRGIVVTNVPDYCLIEVAEHALALLLGLGRKVAYYHQQTKAGQYRLQSGPALRRIANQTLGIIGLGQIGRELAERAAALGMRVLAFSRTQRQAPPGVEWASFNEILERSDYVSLHAPLTPQTRHLIGAAEFARMRPTAYLNQHGPGRTDRHRCVGRGLGRRPAGRRRVGRAGSRATGPGPAALQRSARDRHAARRVCLRRILGESPQSNGGQVAVRLAGGEPENIVNPAVFGR